VYREFFSDWIQPWWDWSTHQYVTEAYNIYLRLHYIPLSQSYKELYNIHAYFSGPTPSMLTAANSTSQPPSGPETLDTAGEKRLKRIARAGRQWKRTIGRKVDMESQSFPLSLFGIELTWLIAYVYRLCLEFARLYADDREAMSYNAKEPSHRW
jgi:hypothetical protein